MHLPTLLTLMNMYTNKFLDYPHSKDMPKVIDGLKPPLDKDFQNKFDFIIVGSGYTGSFLARRLANDGCNKVLVVESGGMPSYDSTIPFMSMSDKTNDQTAFLTVPQRYAGKAMNDEKIMISVPKNLGQVTTSDSSIYIPADLREFHRWSQAYRLDGWSYEDMKKYAFTVSSSTPLPQLRIQKLFSDKNETSKNGNKSSEENLQNDKTLFNDKLADGFRDDILEPLKYGWLKMAKIMGQSVRYGEEQEIFSQGGFFVPKTLARNGSKINPALLYLQSMEDDVTIICHVAAHRIIFDRSGRNILGLELKDENTGYIAFVSARKQVILTSGAIGTAQLLLQSGIGPSDALKKERITVLRDMPVGVRLNDRIRLSLFVNVDSVATELIKAELNDPMQFYRYLEARAGVLANTSIIGVAFIKSRSSDSGPADLMIEIKPSGLMGQQHETAHMNLAAEMQHHMKNDLISNKQIGLEVIITVVKTFSQGTMWLWRMSNDTFTVRANPGYLSDKRDANAMLAGVRFVEKLMRTEFMRDMGARLIFPFFPNCTDQKVQTNTEVLTASEKYWRCVFQHAVTSGHLLTSTTPIGDVVTSRLNIKNLDGIKICDESIFPETPSGGYAATMLTLANKCAQIIQEDIDVECDN